MKRGSSAMLDALAGCRLSIAGQRPRVLFTPEDLETARRRAAQRPGALEQIAREAERAARDERLFGPRPQIPYLARGILGPLAAAAAVCGDGDAQQWARRAHDGVQVMLGFPPEEWIARPHRPMRCDHAMLNVGAEIGLAMDLLAGAWGPEETAAVARRLQELVLPRFLETWRRQDTHWSRPEYHWNWKIMCCGEAGVVALCCAEQVPNLKEVLAAALEGVLDVLDQVPGEGDWPEGIGYWLATLGFGLRCGVGLERITGGAVDLFDHPALGVTGDYVLHVTEPDRGVYDFNDNPRCLGSTLDYLLLLARRQHRPDWLWPVRRSPHLTLERLAWDDPGEPGEPPPERTARLFPWTGVATMRDRWTEEATFVGFKASSSDVAHSHLDANSFVLTSRGERLLVDEGTWPYAHFLGFFDNGGGARFDFDANGTVGHTTLIVDGAGQEWGPDRSARIESLSSEEGVDVAVAEAGPAYGGRLQRFRRSLAFVKPDTLLVYDQVRADRPRMLEWLFHHRGTVSGDVRTSVFRAAAVSFSVRLLLPADPECWRVADVERVSVYTESNDNRRVTPSIRYRSFGPFHSCTSMDALWCIHVRGGAEVGDTGSGGAGGAASRTGDSADPLVETAEDARALSAVVTLAEGVRRTVVFDRIDCP